MMTLRLNSAARAQALTLALSSTTPGEAAELHPIWLKEPRLIADAEELDNAVLNVTRAANACRPRDLKAALHCECGAGDELATLKRNLGRVAASHPDWDAPDTVVTYRRDPNGPWTSLNLPAVRRMIALCTGTTTGTR
jgi:hypothetical protein